MMFPRRKFFKVLLTAVLMFRYRKVDAVKQFTVSGEVLDKGNQGIDNVVVTLHRGPTKVGEAKTKDKDKGNYSISYDEGAPIDTVKYQREGYIDAVVSDLSGARDHSIKKTIYLLGTKLTLLEGQEALSSLERVFYIEEMRNTVKSVAESYVKMLEQIAVPDRLIERKEVVRRLYLDALQA